MSCDHVVTVYGEASNESITGDVRVSSGTLAYSIDELPYFVNDYFALAVFRSFLETDIPEEIEKFLVYAFHYRDERPETLAVIAYCGEEMTRLRKQIDNTTAGE